MFVSIHSFFLGELEKCLEDPDRLAPLFVKQVRNALVLQHDFVRGYYTFLSVIFFSVFVPNIGTETAHVYCVLPKQA